MDLESTAKVVTIHDTTNATQRNSFFVYISIDIYIYIYIEIKK